MKTLLANRNLWLLFVGQLIAVSASSLSVTLGGIIGEHLALNKSLATLPQALHITGIAVFSIPAAMIMRRAGRRFGFSAAALIGALSQVLAIFAIYQRDFVLFTLASVILGCSTAFAVQLRFAAAESVEPGYVARAISFVLVGSIGGAFLGPFLASKAAYLPGMPEYAGGYAIQVVLLTMMAAAFWLLKLRRPAEDRSAPADNRPISEIGRQPLFIAAVLAATASYAVMSLIMTATPLSMHVNDGFSLSDTAGVIRAHVISMYLPALFSGYLIDRFGIGRIMFSGLAIFAACLAIATAGQHYMHYWTALVLLGVGWNFLFVSGTTLLTFTYSSSERFGAQAMNDVFVFGTAAAAALMAGVLIQNFGWTTTVASAAPFVLITAIVLWKIRHEPAMKALPALQDS